MKNSILEDILFENTSIAERIKPNDNYNQINEKCDKIYNEFVSGLKEEQKELFDEFVNENMGLEYEASIEYFKAGFKYALRLAAECLLMI